MIVILLFFKRINSYVRGENTVAHVLASNLESLQHILRVYLSTREQFFKYRIKTHPMKQRPLLPTEYHLIPHKFVANAADGQQ